MYELSLLIIALLYQCMFHNRQGFQHVSVYRLLLPGQIGQQIPSKDVARKPEERKHIITSRLLYWNFSKGFIYYSLIDFLSIWDLSQSVTCIFCVYGSSHECNIQLYVLRLACFWWFVLIALSGNPVQPDLYLTLIPSLKFAFKSCTVSSWAEAWLRQHEAFLQGAFLCKSCCGSRCLRGTLTWLTWWLMISASGTRKHVLSAVFSMLGLAPMSPRAESVNVFWYASSGYMRALINDWVFILDKNQRF